MTTSHATMPGAMSEVEPKTADAWLRSGEAVLIDVREPDEHAAERIEGATLVPLSKFTPSQVPSGRRVIVHCRSGRRSAEAIRTLTAAGPVEAFNLKGGIIAWKEAGLPVVRTAGAARISIMRQMQMTAGSLVLVGVLLAWLVDPWFILLSAFIGAGLVFSGASGTCGMAALLGVMPWNRAACAPRKSADGGPCCD